MAQRHTLPISPVWHLPDDTEDSVVGAEWHQLVIRSLVSALQDLAGRAHPAWHVGDQLTLIGPHSDPQELWRPKPDVVLHPTMGPALLRDLDTRSKGVPALLIEVLSPTTQRRDLSLMSPGPSGPGKAWAYLELWQVPEYLTFDPLAEFVKDQVRAWRRVQGRTVDWVPEQGRYVSALGISFAVEGSLLRVYDEQGEIVPFDREKTLMLAERDQQLALRDQQLADRDQQLALRDELAAQQERIITTQAAQLEVLTQHEQRLRELEAELRRLRGEGLDL